MLPLGVCAEQRCSCGSRVLKAQFDLHCERVRSTEYALRGPFQYLERLHGLAEIVQRGVGVRVERTCVIRPHGERVFMACP